MENLLAGKPPEKTQILSFSNRRGRPKTNRPVVDTGTPETVMKRLLGVTTEALDLCLERGIITPEQHWCGIHLRWLYTLRHGVPDIRATDLSNIGGCEYKPIEYDDPLWRAEREKEYNNAINLLAKTGHAILLINLCIYNERPKFLNFLPDKLQKNTGITENITKISDGLAILAKLWKH